MRTVTTGFPTYHTFAKDFPFVFEGHGFEAKMWCEENLGPSGFEVQAKIRNIHYTYRIDTSRRWVFFQMTVFISNQTDATAFKMVWG